jgi:DnaK suppressor protein
MPIKKSVKTAKKSSAKKIVIKKTLSKKAIAQKAEKKVTHTVPKKSSVTTAKSPKQTQKLSLRVKKIHEIKKILLSQRKELLVGALEALNELPGQTAFPDLGDQATAEIDRNFMLRIKGRERKLLKKIDEAIDRINQNTFGICEKCDLDINIKRLEARPVTTMCIECKILQEEEEKLRER